MLIRCSPVIINLLQPMLGATHNPMIIQNKWPYRYQLNELLARQEGSEAVIVQGPGEGKASHPLYPSTQIPQASGHTSEAISRSMLTCCHLKNPVMEWALRAGKMR